LAHDEERTSHENSMLIMQKNMIHILSYLPPIPKPLIRLSLLFLFFFISPIHFAFAEGQAKDEFQAQWFIDIHSKLNSVLPDWLFYSLLPSFIILLMLIAVSLFLKSQIRKNTALLQEANEELRTEIEDRIKVQEDLARSEAKSRQIVDYATDAIFFLQDGLIAFFNHSATELFGCLDNDLLQRDFADLIHSDDREKVIDWLVDVNEGYGTEESVQFRLYCKQDTKTWVNLHAVPSTYENMPALLCYMRDISRELYFEQQHLQAQRMEAIGILAGGVAHDFNNLLTGIQGHATLLLMEINEDHPHFHDLSAIENLVKNASSLTKQLLSFSRGTEHSLTPVDINLLLDETLSMFSRTRKEIRVTRNFDAGLMDILADKGQVSQVFLNLFINASQAMPEGGNLTVEAKTIRLHEEFVRHHGVQAGKFVKVDITDTGIGMDENTRQRIFDPFFTTKKEKGGTGIGLASSYGIIKNHGGIVTVESQIDYGSKFSIFLPATEKSGDSGDSNLEEIIKGEGTILVVDDEESVLETSQILLQMVGYEVLTAKTGMEALAIYKVKKPDIDLVLLDIIMPGMDGAEVFQALKEINPDVKVLLASGYNIKSQANKLLEMGCHSFIQKPFALEKLTAEINHILTDSK